MNNYKWDCPHAFGNQVNFSNPQTTSLGNVKRTGEWFSWYCSDDFRAKIQPPSSRQYKPGDFLAVRQLNRDVIIDKDVDDETSVDPGTPSCGRTHPGDSNDNDESYGEYDMQGREKVTGKEK